MRLLLVAEAGGVRREEAVCPASAYPRTPVSWLTSAVDRRSTCDLRGVDRARTRCRASESRDTRQRARDAAPEHQHHERRRGEGEPLIDAQAGSEARAPGRVGSPGRSCALVSNIAADVVGELAAVECLHAAHEAPGDAPPSSVGAGVSADAARRGARSPRRSAVRRPPFDQAVGVEQQRPGCGQLEAVRREVRPAEADRRRGRRGPPWPAGDGDRRRVPGECAQPPLRSASIRRTRAWS